MDPNDSNQLIDAKLLNKDADRSRWFKMAILQILANHAVST